MPYRSGHLVMAIAGVLTVAALVVFGVSLRRAARSGPHWRRRLVAAGLMLLASMGLVAAEEAGRVDAGTSAGATTDSLSGKSLADTDQWKLLTITWKEAEDVASGRRGDYPFDQAGKEKLLGALAEARQDVDVLRKAALLSEPEADLLAKDLGQLTAGVQAKRPTEMKNYTCYEPMMPTECRDAFKRLSQRVPALEKMVEVEALKPEVVEKVLKCIEADAEFLLAWKPGPGGYTDDKPPEESKDVCQRAKKAAASLRARLATGSDALMETPQWRTIKAAWQFVAPLAESGQSTTAQRKTGEQHLNDAKTAAQQLGRQGAITPSESQLLVQEANRLSQQMRRNPPTDAEVLCYIVGAINQAGMSLERLSRQLPLLQKMAETGKLHGPVLAKVLPTIEADLKTLGDETELKSLGPDGKANAAKLREQVQQALDEIHHGQQQEIHWEE